MKWFNEPSQWSADDGRIVANADPHTDFGESPIMATCEITHISMVRPSAPISD
jgi:regulation of enolase protein 1 (concanavalin A-like superfamily)